MTPLLSLLLLFCSLNGAQAGTRELTAQRGLFAARLEAYSRELETFRSSGAECSGRYSALFGKDALAISVFIGFSDSGAPDLVLDRPIRQALVDRLRSGCSEKRSACGFAAAAPASDDGPAVLTKTVRLGPQKKRVTLRIFDSSVSEKHSECVSALSGSQELKSGSVTLEYLKALKNDDIVLYLGHSRYGTSPGFSPPRFFSAAGLKTFSQRPLLSLMREALDNSGRAPAIIGFFSCASEKFYGGLAHSLSPASALFVSSDITTHMNGVLSLAGFLDSILGMQCRDSFQKSVNEGGRISLYDLYGFFDRAPHIHYGRNIPILYDLAALLLIPFFILPAAGLFGPGRVFPPAPAAGAGRGLALLLLSALPGLLLARLSGANTGAALPLVLSLSGGFLLASCFYARKIAAGDLGLFARRTLPFISAAAVVCFCLTLLPLISPDNAVYSSRQALKLSLLFAVLLPFFTLSENILLAPFAGGGVKGFARSTVLSLACYFAVCAGLNAAAPRITLSLTSVFALVLYKQSVSFLLYRHRPEMAGPVVFQTLTMAWIFTEGMQLFLYN